MFSGFVSSQYVSSFAYIDTDTRAMGSWYLRVREIVIVKNFFLYNNISQHELINSLLSCSNPLLINCMFTNCVHVNSGNSVHVDLFICTLFNMVKFGVNPKLNPLPLTPILMINVDACYCIF